MGDEYAYLVMGICILVMLGYGHDESAPTPDGVFRTNFVVDVGNWRSVSQPISWCSWGIVGVFALYFVGVKETFTKCSQRVRNLFDIHS
ncbi:MAG: hypothetical protein HXN67_07595 [Prevotella pallens]|nr:hypothetical protein [Prevotella pallens]